MPAPSLIKRLRDSLSRLFFWIPRQGEHEERRPEHHHDHALVLAVTTPKRLPKWRQMRYIFRVLSPIERRLFLLTTLLGVVALIGMSTIYIRSRLVNIPVVGGTYTEALIGQPKYINPLDALTNDVDQDFVRLIYSGLFRYDGLAIVPDLAEDFSWSADGKTLTVKLRKDARFHDNVPVSADDIRFTLDALQNPDRKSPLAPLFRGVTLAIENDTTIVFTLDKPNPFFVNALTVGILPSHSWNDVSVPNARLSDLNLKPVGSGPYRVKQFSRDSLGSIRSYTLERNDQYYGTKPFIKNIVFQFFASRNEALDAYKSNLVDGVAFANESDVNKLKSSSRGSIVHLELPQETIAFFNVKDKTVSDVNVRRALLLAVNRADIVAALNGAATPISGPFPFTTTSTTQDLDTARDLLTKAGWVLPEGGDVRIWSPPKQAATPAKSTASKKTTAKATPPTPTPVVPIVIAASSTQLELTITVPNEPDMFVIAQVLQRQWSVLGAKVTLTPVTTDELMRLATRDRKTQITLINILMGAEQELFPFWWSGQVADRGLNISNLSDRTVDDALDHIRTAATIDAVLRARDELAAAIDHDAPAAFLVRPAQQYLIAKKIFGVPDQLQIAAPAERLSGLLSWYSKTGWRWK